MVQPATKYVWFYEMKDDGYSLDDKRAKKDGYGDLQDIVARFHQRDAEKDTDRTQKWFSVPRTEIESDENNYDLSLSRYKEDVFEEVMYEKPGVILERLLAAELGRLESGIVKELLELKEMIG